MSFITTKPVVELACIALLAACALTACETDPPGRVESSSEAGDDDAGPSGDDDAGMLAPCSGEPDGMACGPERHCIEQRCVPNRCGDGVRAGDEACDDGNERLGDACSPSCAATPASCGDGVLDEGEECDDGNLLNADACANGCTENACGNGRIDAEEQCDDGNADDLDACSNACTRSRCRNGLLDPGEECDDGNTDHNDGCSNACELVACGDGEATNEEECDDGNRVDDDGCSNTCTTNACNNGRLDPGEACDGGLTADGAPIAPGSVCNAACDAVELDMCGACEAQHCTNYAGSGVDLTAFCYDTVPEGSESTADFNRKCTDLIQCIRTSECDVGAVLPDAYACYCGKDTTLDQCSAGINIVGPCIAEFEAATDAAPGDYVWVSNYGADTTTPSGFAYYLAQCHREHCLDVCR